MSDEKQSDEKLSEILAYQLGRLKPNINSSAADGLGCWHYDHGCYDCRENARLVERARVLEAKAAALDEIATYLGEPREARFHASILDIINRRLRSRIIGGPATVVDG